MSDATPTSLDRLAESHLERFASLNPNEATQMGILGHETELTDLSPAGSAANAALARETLAALPGIADERPADAIARMSMEERLSLLLEREAAGDHLRPLAPIGSPVQDAALVFTLMATETDEDWAIVAERMEKVPAMLAGLSDSLRLGLERGIVAARRQAITCARQARARSGEEGTAFHVSFVERYAGGDRALRNRLGRAAAGAAASFGELARFLEETYAPGAAEADGVGRDRYALCSRDYTGIMLDLEETYSWGIEELARLQAEMREVADKILPGEPLPAVFDHLEKDASRTIEGEAAFLAWNQQLLDETMAALEGTFFDIPAPVRSLEAMIAPPGGAAAMYYTPPNEDFSRPGRTWYPTLGRTHFPLWMEPSIAYHEGVPGHHLQIGMNVYMGERLNAFQRHMGFTSGNAEGWALYAERLMAELGFLDDPAYYLGMLSNQAFRAVRVIVDIGLHLGFSIPPGEEGAGEPWSAARAVEFLIAASGRQRPFAESEVERYLGLPGQAISYKVGERYWLETRAGARDALGARFDLKAFHKASFDLGLVGLGQLSTLASGEYARPSSARQ